MRHICTLLIILLAFTSHSQEIIDREVGEFSAVKVFDLIEVNLIQSEQNRVVIKGENTNYVKIINDNGTLKLRMELDRRFDGDETFIEVYYNDLQLIDANEGAYIAGNEMLQQNTIELRAQEGGRINIGLDANHVKTKAVTGGIVAVSGKADSQEIVLTTGGIFEGKELKTKDTEIKITAAGEADIYATDRAKVRITAGGDVHVYGNPERVDKKNFAGGRVYVVN